VKNFILSQTDFLIFPLIAVVAFFVFFVATVIWVYRPGGRVVYDARSMLALRDSADEEGAR